jgi:hypothetical protein
MQARASEVPVECRTPRFSSWMAGYFIHTPQETKVCQGHRMRAIVQILVGDMRQCSNSVSKKASCNSGVSEPRKVGTDAVWRYREKGRPKTQLEQRPLPWWAWIQKLLVTVAPLAQVQYGQEGALHGTGSQVMLP